MTDSFIRTNTILDTILARKQEEIAIRQVEIGMNKMRQLAEEASPPRDMLAALKKDTVSLIAEVKHASPSKGVLIEDFDPVAIGTIYDQNGAAAISVLTDEHFFQGHLDYLTDVSNSVRIPVLRKDFIMHPYQIYEGRSAGADAILLIVAALSDSQLADLHSLIVSLGMTPLVEVHNETEIERALQLAVQLIGINNRDLKSFHVDLETTAKLAQLVPDGIVLVAESGIKDANDVYRMGQLGAHAVLVGESLVKSGDMSIAVRQYSKQIRNPIT